MILLCLLLAADADAVVSARRAEVQKAAEAAARPALVTICNGRCELVDVRADVVANKRVLDAMPGFESLAKEDTELVVRSLEVTVAVDARLAAATQSGIKSALETALQGLAKTTTVSLRAFQWPSAREQAPIVVQMQPVAQPPQQVVVAPPPPAPKEPEDPPLVRLQKRAIDAGPWLLGAIIVAALLRSGLRRKDETKPSVAGAAAPNEPAAPLLGDRALTAKALADRALAAHVLRRVLTRLRPEEAAGLVPLVPIDALADAMDSALAPALAAATQIARTRKTLGPDAATQLEAHVVAAQRECLHDARLWRLQLASEEVLAAVLLGLSPADRVRVWTFTPPELRDAAATLLGEAERQTLISAVMSAVGRAEIACDDDAAARIDRVCEAKAKAALLLEGVVLDAARADAAPPSPAWEKLLVAATVGEADIAAADDAAIVELIFAVAPETLVDFLHGTSDAARERIVAKLPAYLRAAWQGSERAQPAAKERAARAVVDAFRRLRRRHDVAAQRAIVALLSEGVDGEGHVTVVKVVK
ncbi:MAG: hypothetical protein IT381_20615 [Deltaproteobacteria bacterium]|nr:hypothetical protein [Deltaproteobacteria bacterium]